MSTKNSAVRKVSTPLYFEHSNSSQQSRFPYVPSSPAKSHFGISPAGSRQSTRNPFTSRDNFTTSDFFGTSQTRDLATFFKTSGPEDVQRPVSSLSRHGALGSTYRKGIRLLRPRKSKPKLSIPPITQIPNSVIMKTTSEGNPYLQIRIDYKDSNSSSRDFQPASYHHRPSQPYDMKDRIASSTVTNQSSNFERNLSPAPWSSAYSNRPDNKNPNIHIPRHLREEQYPDAPREVLPTVRKVHPADFHTSSLSTITSLPQIQSSNNEIRYTTNNVRTISRHRSLNIHSSIRDNPRISASGETLAQEKTSANPPIDTHDTLSSSRVYEARSGSPDTILVFQYNESVDSICSPEVESPRTIVPLSPRYSISVPQHTREEHQTDFRLGQVPKRRKENVGSRVDVATTVNPHSDSTGSLTTEIFGSAERPIRRKTGKDVVTTSSPIFRVDPPSPSIVTGTRNSFGKLSPLAPSSEPIPSIRRSRSFPPGEEEDEDLERRIMAVEKRNRVLEQIVVALLRGSIGNNRRRSTGAQRDSTNLEDILKKQEAPSF